MNEAVASDSAPCTNTHPKKSNSLIFLTNLYALKKQCEVLYNQSAFSNTNGWWKGTGCTLHEGHMMGGKMFVLLGEVVLCCSVVTSDPATASGFPGASARWGSWTVSPMCWRELCCLPEFWSGFSASSFSLSVVSLVVSSAGRKDKE